MGNPNYEGKKAIREQPIPKTYRKLESIGDLDLATCYLHGGRQKRNECQGCIDNYDIDRDYDGMMEAMGDA